MKEKKSCVIQKVAGIHCISIWILNFDLTVTCNIFFLNCERFKLSESVKRVCYYFWMSLRYHLFWLCCCVVWSSGRWIQWNMLIQPKQFIYETRDTARRPVQIMLPEGFFREERSGLSCHSHNIILYTWQVYRPPPPEISLSVCCEYVENLPTVDAPELFGMDQNADTAFLANQGRGLLAHLLAAQPRLTAGVGYVICLRVLEPPRNVIWTKQWNCV